MVLFLMVINMHFSIVIGGSVGETAVQPVFLAA
jgi:hypothetical protein